MSGAKFSLKQFINPPPKVLLMFQAVMELMEEDVDFSKMTVQDITARAGIGKGTAYEYFSSKEEMIAMALFHDYGGKLRELKALVEAQPDFKGRMYCVMDWMRAHAGYHKAFAQIIKLSAGTQNPCIMLQESAPKGIFHEMHLYLMTECDALMEEGYRQGLFGQTDPVKRRIAFATMVMQVVMILEPKQECGFFDMEYESMRSFAYETLIKTLN